MKEITIFILLLFEAISVESAEMIQRSAYWSGQFFSENCLDNPQKISTISDPSVVYHCGHINCYGHALLDGIIPLYKILKENDLLFKHCNILIPVDDERKSSTYKNIIQFVQEIFPYAKLILLEKGKNTEKFHITNLFVDKHLTLDQFSNKYLSFYEAMPESFAYINVLKSYGFIDNLVFKDPYAGNTLISEFSEYVKNSYGFHIPMQKNKVLICKRKFSRKILNEMELVSELQNTGFEVELLDFEEMSIKEQIRKVLESEYLIGTYGSNLTNAIFMNADAKVVVLWHIYAKYFWSRRYCIIHSAFLSAGVTLIEFDKPSYDPRDVYTCPYMTENYFVKKENIIYLLPQRINIDQIVNYPLPAMYEITNVDLYIDPKKLQQILLLD